MTRDEYQKFDSLLIGVITSPSYSGGLRSEAESLRKKLGKEQEKHINTLRCIDAIFSQAKGG